MNISTSANLFNKQVTGLLLAAKKQFVLILSFGVFPVALLNKVKEVANRNSLQVTIVVTQLARISSFNVPLENFVAGMFSFLELRAVGNLYGSLVANEKEGFFLMEQELAEAGTPDLLWPFSRHYQPNDEVFDDLAYINEIIAGSVLLLQIG